MDLDTSWDPLDLADDGWDRQTSNQDEDFTSEPDTSTATYLSQWTRPTTIPNAYHPQPQYIDPGYDFTSEQAAKALTSLSHSPTKGFDADDFLDCCQPCDQQCDPNEIFPCFSVDTVPCYDSTCSQTCELDGLNTLCNDIHTDGMEGILCCLHQGCTFQTLSEAELLHHCTIAHACGARTQWECRHQNFTETNTMQGHVHNEHCRDEFINPLLLHPDGCLKKPTIPSHYHTHRHQEVPSSHFQTFHTSFHSNPSSSSSACCHIPDKEGTCMHDHGILHTGKSERSRKSFDHGSVVSSRKTSISTPPSDWTCTSPVSSARSEPFGAVLDDRGGPRKVYSCCWIPEQSTTPCSLTFNSPLELQTHIEDFHLASCENLPVQQKAEQLICHWKGCPFAQTKKKWRQVQHLKDHLRTHTKHKAYRCDQCHRLFSEKKSLEQHRRIHTGEKPFKCDQCGASFSHQSTLSTHRRTHTGEKPYYCEICGHRDADHANFQRHKLIHEPAKYKCEYCNAEFKKKANMLRHQKNKACRSLKE